MAKILVIEDENHIWSVIDYKLSKEGHELIRAEDGLEAQVLVREESPDLVISDVLVPYVNGLQILQEIKSDPELKQIPVIMLSSKSQEKDVLKGLELGATDYIKKPFSPEELILRVNKVLKRRMAQKENIKTPPPAAVKGFVYPTKGKRSALGEEDFSDLL